MIKGYCDPEFQNVYDAFSNAITSGFETGAALAIEHQGKIITNLWGGYQDFNKTKGMGRRHLGQCFLCHLKGLQQHVYPGLIDQGKLDPNKSVGDYWPEYSCNGKEDTKVSDLLCHRAAMFGFKDGIPLGFISRLG
jgi:CubicO group peptidase (beta-lactamase class C family)